MVSGNSLIDTSQSIRVYGESSPHTAFPKHAQGSGQKPGTGVILAQSPGHRRHDIPDSPYVSVSAV